MAKEVQMTKDQREELSQTIEGPEGGVTSDCGSALASGGLAIGRRGGHVMPSWWPSSGAMMVGTRLKSLPHWDDQSVSILEPTATRRLQTAQHAPTDWVSDYL